VEALFWLGPSHQRVSIATPLHTTGGNESLRNSAGAASFLCSYRAPIYDLTDKISRTYANSSDCCLQMWRDNQLLMQLFEPEELEALVCGGTDLDFNALQRAARYEDGFDEKSEVRQPRLPLPCS